MAYKHLVYEQVFEARRGDIETGVIPDYFAYMAHF